MNKKDYIEALINEMNNFQNFNQQELLLQAKEVIEQFDDIDLIKQMGTPQEYLMELFEINDIKPVFKPVHEKIKAKKGFSNFIKLFTAIVSGSMVIDISSDYYNISFVAVAFVILTILFSKNKYKTFFIFGIISILSIDKYNAYQRFLSMTIYENNMINDYDSYILYCLVVYFGILLTYLMLTNLKSKRKINPSKEYVLSNKWGKTTYVISNNDLPDIYLYNEVGSLVLDTRNYMFKNGTLTIHIDNFIGSVIIISGDDVSYQSFLSSHLGSVNINNSVLNDNKQIILQGRNKIASIEVGSNLQDFNN